jgi:hypothetical protein
LIHHLYTAFIYWVSASLDWFRPKLDRCTILNTAGNSPERSYHLLKTIRFTS